jgi:ribonucleotide monophosphatase NagD (HAD superfamily)
MGLPDAMQHDAEREILRAALSRGQTLICSNPDRTSPRAGGRLVESPGALAHDYAAAGGTVLFYGKPHRPIFDALAPKLLGAERILMVGDSPAHDIAGAKDAGWDTVFISGGIHADQANIAALFDGIGLPDFTLPLLR